MKRQQLIILLGVCGIVASLPATAPAQQTSQSPSDATQKAKDQQKQTPKPKVWTNDNLPAAPVVSVVGEVSRQGTGVGGSSAASLENNGNLTSERDKTVAALSQAKTALADAKTDLDLAQRAYRLDSDQYYGAPDYADDKQGKTRLANDQEQISSKQQAADAAQKKVDDLQKQMDTLNGKLKSTPDSSQPKG